MPLRLRFVGQVSAQLRGQIVAAGLGGITEYVDFVPHEQSVSYLMESSVLLMAIPDVANNQGILPGKVFEYLATSKPILCVGPAGSDADELLQACGAGRALPYDAYAQMLEELEALAAQWRINPDLDLPGAHPERYSRRSLTAQLAGLLKQ